MYLPRLHHGTRFQQTYQSFAKPRKDAYSLLDTSYALQHFWEFLVLSVMCHYCPSSMNWNKQTNKIIMEHFFLWKIKKQETLSEGPLHSFKASRRSQSLLATQVIFNPYCKQEETSAIKTHKSQIKPPAHIDNTKPHRPLHYRIGVLPPSSIPNA